MSGSVYIQDDTWAAQTCSVNWKTLKTLKMFQNLVMSLQGINYPKSCKLHKSQKHNKFVQMTQKQTQLYIKSWQWTSQKCCGNLYINYNGLFFLLCLKLHFYQLLPRSTVKNGLIVVWNNVKVKPIFDCPIFFIFF